MNVIYDFIVFVFVYMQSNFTHSRLFLTMYAVTGINLRHDYLLCYNCTHIDVISCMIGPIFFYVAKILCHECLINITTATVEKTFICLRISWLQLHIIYNYVKHVYEYNENNILKLPKVLRHWCINCLHVYDKNT